MNVVSLPWIDLRNDLFSLSLKISLSTIFEHQVQRFLGSSDSFAK